MYISMAISLLLHLAKPHCVKLIQVKMLVRALMENNRKSPSQIIFDISWSIGPNKSQGFPVQVSRFGYAKLK